MWQTWGFSTFSLFTNALYLIMYKRVYDRTKLVGAFMIFSTLADCAYHATGEKHPIILNAVSTPAFVAGILAGFIFMLSKRRYLHFLTAAISMALIAWTNTLTSPRLGDPTFDIFTMPDRDSWPYFMTAHSMAHLFTAGIAIMLTSCAELS